jgi:hypothetical protein
MPFTCSICGEESTRICARCTKDACDNHLCEKCLRCSDCCECEITLAEPTTYRVVHPGAAKPAAAPETAVDPAPPVIQQPEPVMPETMPPAEVPPNQPDAAAAESEEPNAGAPRPTQYNG